MLYPLKSIAIFLMLTISMLLSSPVTYANDSMQEFELAMSKNKGKVVYVDFWASWCVPCRKSFPWMNAMQSKHQKQGFVVLSINLDANTALAEKFLKKIPANFDVIYDAKGLLAKKFQLKGMPSSYLFNRQGKIISAHNGFNGKKQLKFEQEIAIALER